MFMGFVSFVFVEFILSSLANCSSVSKTEDRGLFFVIGLSDPLNFSALGWFSSAHGCLCLYGFFSYAPVVIDCSAFSPSLWGHLWRDEQVAASIENHMERPWPLSFTLTKMRLSMSSNFDLQETRSGRGRRTKAGARTAVQTRRTS